MLLVKAHGVGAREHVSERISTLTIQGAIAGTATWRRIGNSVDLLLCAKRTDNRMDVKAIRSKLGLTQRQFAERFKLNKHTVSNWEKTASSTPSGAALTLLLVIKHHPDIVHAVLELEDYLTHNPAIDRDE